MTVTATATDPTTIARGVLARLEVAWNAADGNAFGAVYAPDAAFVTIRGEYLTGSAAIGAGHHGIFTTIYAGSVNRMELVRADELADGVVLAVSVNTLDCPHGPLAGVHQAVSTSVLARQGAADGGAAMGDGNGWLVVATHNTLVTV